MEQHKKDVYILNYWYGNNYGASLTAYALCVALKELSHEPYLVDNMNEQNFYLQKYLFSQKFLEPLCKITPNISDYSYLQSINNDQNIFMTGSDQVFRPYLAKNKLGDFLLDFTGENIRKVAISASFGVDKEQFLKETSAETISKMKQSLNSFDYISVREKSGVDICRDIFDIAAEWVIDPVFMIDKKYYLEIANQSNKNYSDKIFSYVFSKDPLYKKIYGKLEKDYNAKVEGFAYKNNPMEDWLSAVINSKLVITDSFHGVCFCLIFNKPFICPAKNMIAYTRFDSLFEMLGIKNQTVTANEILTENCVFNIDYTKVNNVIKKERDKGLNVLKKVTEDFHVNNKDRKSIRTRYLEEKLCELKIQTNLKYQIKKKIWIYWLIFWCNYLPKFVKYIINILRGKNGYN